jgi:hypothetical protein
MSIKLALSSCLLLDRVVIVFFASVLPEWDPQAENTDCETCDQRTVQSWDG